ncbi:AhpC/TSA family protein [Flavobacterium amnicola]|uniref:AhpC/TSA family protein n=1 Tax=Flavobacterium amnicola TaxID=2506422 RepID=A0A4Q1K365_9FLAO|nr:TlpA disulfide reductase family protein [Flavobacterium amnicola]RXR16329.1 AhpC/TSA family protein [Flavobacterium amnicola]
MINNKIIYILFFIITVSCNKSQSDITGTAKFPDGTLVFIEKNDPLKGPVKIDSTYIKDNTFQFRKQTKELDLLTIRFNNIKGAFYVISEEGKINIKVDTDTLQKSIVEGAYHNTELTKFNKNISIIENQIRQFEKNNIHALKSAEKSNNTKLVNEIKNQHAVLIAKKFNANYDYVKGNPKSFVSLLIVEGMLREFEPNYPKIKELFTILSNDLKSNKRGRKISAKLQSVEAVAIGKIAPDFSAPTPDGNLTTLKANLGKVTILYFSGSWCEPCKIKNQYYTTLYSEFHPKGLNIVNISLEIKGQREKWKAAIKEQKMSWVSVSNLDNWNDPLAKLYSIDGFPAVFILDSKGIIVAKNLEGDPLKKKIIELLSK